MAKETKIRERPCGGNEGITCSTPDRCGKCGWNPEVAKARMDKYNSQFREAAK